MKSVSVIIPTFNGERTLPQLLGGLASQTHKVDEIIVVDSSSDDNTRDVASSFGIVPILIRREEFNHGSTRNMAASVAKGEILVFMTQDAIPANKEMIENLIKPLDDERVVCSYGRHIPKEDADLTERFSRGFNYPDYPLLKGRDDIKRLGIKTFFFSNVCSAIKKKVFDEVNGFDAVDMNEDMLFAEKIIHLGYLIAYCPEAQVFHSHNYSHIEQFKRYFDISKSLRERKLLKYKTVEKEGRSFVKEGVRFCLQKGGLIETGRFFVSVFFRYLGYQLGKISDVIPSSIEGHLSMYGGKR
ncbi:MAG: glycosyltransferase family 2 protein [Nitrospirae bacterium]|nr:MAG: glycosyltransferase family 2 protein [Nitrospirota bacterium]